MRERCQVIGAFESEGIAEEEFGEFFAVAYESRKLNAVVPLGKDDERSLVGQEVGETGIDGFGTGEVSQVGAAGQGNNCRKEENRTKKCMHPHRFFGFDKRIFFRWENANPG